MRSNRSYAGGQERGGPDLSAGLPHGRDPGPDALAPRAAPQGAARAFEQAMRGGRLPGARARDHGAAPGGDGETPGDDEMLGDGETLGDNEMLGDGGAFGDGGAPRDPGRDARDAWGVDQRDRARCADRDAASRIRDVWSLFATGAAGTLAPVALPEPGAAREAAPRDLLDDLFAMVVALRGDVSGTAVIEIDLDERTLPGVSVRIAETDARLCFTFFCRRADGFRRLAGQAARMAGLLHERLARPVGVAVRHRGDGDKDNDIDGGTGDVDVAVG
ncbi:hypothetical protein OVY01_08560 [Robbsia sp. Bb-Pol-6]|uniref:Uncharacterized protein n=1 Tax=Robbsia betulipollinis TaxID=2981849 RepID=A0ABT3ZL74_9BURK|nr:hypothetical protein [Robbsia betulipollinis]MCY0387284.1 hypothetical protein [Robbsia betulipollinis]